MSPQASPPAQPTAATPAVEGVASPAATVRPAPTPIVTPTLKAGEYITWVKFERPKLALGDILISSFTIIGITILLAVGLGLIIGYLRSRRPKDLTHGAGGLGLR